MECEKFWAEVGGGRKGNGSGRDGTGRTMIIFKPVWFQILSHIFLNREKDYCYIFIILLLGIHEPPFTFLSRLVGLYIFEYIFRRLVGSLLTICGKWATRVPLQKLLQPSYPLAATQYVSDF